MNDLNIDENKKVAERTSGDDPRPFRNKVLPHAIFESMPTYRIDRSSIKAAGIEVAPKKGGNADVELAIFCPILPVQSPLTDAPQYIAVRKTRFRDDADDQRVRARFAYELDIWVSHENIVKLVGFVESTEDRIAWMVFRWEENGNLREFIRDVASGLDYLHSQDSPICHGDLKSLNILVSSENRAMLADFGSARILPTGDGATDTNQEGILNEYPRDGSTSGAVDFFQVEVDESATFVTITGPDWTVRWAAPELLDEGPTSLASDIWAFGWICWEVMTGHFPFEDVDRFPGIVARIIQGKLPQTDDQVYLSQVRELCSLMTSCWRATASSRPTASSCRGNLNWMTSIVPSAARMGGSPQTHSAELLLAIGRTHYVHGRLREAAHQFTKSLEIARQTKNDLGVAEAVYGLADIAHGQSDSSKAESFYTEARAIFSRLGHQLVAARTAGRLGSIFSNQGYYSKAESMHHEAHDIYDRAENLPGLGNSCLALGALYRLQQRHSKAESLLNRARDIFGIVDQRRGVANANIELGRLHGTQGHFSTAEELLVEARELYEQIGDQLGLENAMCGLGEAYYVRAKYETSEAFFTQAKDISTLVKNQLGIAHSVLGLGNVYLKQEKSTEAESCYIEAQSAYNRIGNSLGIAESSSGLSKVYYRQGFCHKAEPALIECRDAYAQLGDQSGLAGAICGLGHVYQRQDDYAKAEASFTEARELFEKEGDRDGIAQCAFGLGSICHWLDRDSEAEALLSEARDVYIQIGNQSSVAEVIAMLGNVYRSQNDYFKAEMSYVEAIEICSRLGRKHFKADVLYDLGLLRGRQERFLDTEKCIEDACVIYHELGLDDEVLGCVQLLEKAREIIRTAD